MKIKIVLLTLLFTAFAVTARMMEVFSNWGNVRNRAHDIVIVNCGKPIVTVLPPNNIITGAAESDSEVEISYVLKGTNSLGMARLKTDHVLHQGEDYLVFGNFEN